MKRKTVQTVAQTLPKYTIGINDQDDKLYLSKEKTETGELIFIEFNNSTENKLWWSTSLINTVSMLDKISLKDRPKCFMFKKSPEFIGKIYVTIQLKEEENYTAKYMQEKKILTYKGYSTEIEYSLEDLIWHGHILNINDTVLFCSDEYSEFEKEFHTAVDEYIEACKEMGVEPDTINHDRQ